MIRAALRDTMIILGVLLALTGGILVLAFTGVARAQTPTIAGVYTVEGTNPDHTTYRGIAKVTEADGRLLIEVTDPNGVLMSVAIAIRDGDVISAIFQTRDGGIGLASYRVVNGVWQGKWLVPGFPETMSETLTRTDDKLHGAESGPTSKL